VNGGGERTERDTEAPGRSEGGTRAREAALNNNLVCIYVNARSIMNKLLWLEAVVEAMSPDIIGITES
jgi:hypothetical protein